MKYLSLARQSHTRCHERLHIHASRYVQKQPRIPIDPRHTHAHRPDQTAPSVAVGGKGNFRSRTSREHQSRARLTIPIRGMEPSCASEWVMNCAREASRLEPTSFSCLPMSHSHMLHLLSATNNFVKMYNHPHRCTVRRGSW